MDGITKRNLNKLITCGKCGSDIIATGEEKMVAYGIYLMKCKCGNEIEVHGHVFANMVRRNKGLHQNASPIYERGVMFRKMLGMRSLIQSAIQLDHEINHMITYTPVTSYNPRDGKDRFEITLFARGNKSPAMAWVLKLQVMGYELTRIMDIIYHMILLYEKLTPKKEAILDEGNSHGRTGKLITTNLNTPVSAKSDTRPN